MNEPELTEDMAYMAVVFMLRDACGCTMEQADRLWHEWLDGIRHEAWAEGQAEGYQTGLKGREPEDNPYDSDRDGAEAAWLAALDTALQQHDPSLGELDFNDRIMPAWFDETGILIGRIDRLEGRLAYENGDAWAEWDGNRYDSPAMLAAAWAERLEGEHHGR
ncbi:hypothetical protein [Bifidobacterium felsineum]|uniref:hypothetical protein n=1 Tax=Bifidobacterium felsineum TaxID=2045440 RepID=UPI001BDC89B8|nr:hypothetical protein [Bifidobacterium felsineum]MBT1164667.1 hypothetical protein [Bifidobacterium felsineum]